jgi:membrane associated rhomboid family serine protease
MRDRGGTHPPDPDDPAERTSGLIMETCYRHPRVVTGVHCTRCGRPICPECMHPAPVGYQCPQCVAEASRTAPRRRARLRFFLGRPGSVTSTLLVVNIAMFLVELATGASGGLWTGGSGQKLFDLGALYAPAVVDGQYWRLFTAMFLHAGILHILFNMYALYLFGYLIENALGSLRFIGVYFVAGFVAMAVSFAFADPNVPAVGASGAIFALLGAWVAYNFRRRGSIQASYNLRWALMLIGLNLFLGFSIPNIDNYAHVGGLIAGIAAGWFAEGFGPRNVRLAVQVAGFAVLILVGVGLTAWRVAALTPA